MSNKEQVKHLSCVFVCVFAHAGHIKKEEAKEISGLDDNEFEKAYNKASVITDKVMQSKGNKMNKFMDHLAQEVQEYLEQYGAKLFGGA